jgi:hypothetical protein
MQIREDNENGFEWSFLPQKPTNKIVIWCNDRELKLLLLPSLKGVVEYHPDRVLCQLRLQQGSLRDCEMPVRYNTFETNNCELIIRVNDYLLAGVNAEALHIPQGTSMTSEYARQKLCDWPDPYQKPNYRGAREPLKL